MAKEKFERTSGRIDAPLGKAQYLEGGPAYKPTTAQVNKLRKLTGLGVMDCKEALVEAKGDELAAIGVLKRKGLAMAVELSGHTANEGCVVSKSSSDHKYAVIIKLNCETDFVANTPAFVKLAQDIADRAVTKRVKKYDSLLLTTINGETVRDLIANQSALTKEKVTIGGFQAIEGAYVDNYNHGTRLAAIVEMDSPFSLGDKLVHNICMQVAATNPMFISPDKITQTERNNYYTDILNKIKAESANATRVPPLQEAMERLAVQRLEQFLKENSLVNQNSIIDESKTIGECLKPYKANVVRFVRMETTAAASQNTLVTVPYVEQAATPTPAPTNTKPAQNNNANTSGNNRKPANNGDRKEDLTDLLPIKGISIAMKKNLGRKCNIYDIPGLICKGYSVAGRNKIANQLQIDVRYVTLWLKQADLWRIPDMDANLAYLAVLAGVRHVEDYAKVDPQKLMPVLRTLVASHPDMKLPNEETVSMSIDYAKLFVKNMSGKTYQLEINEEEPVRLFADPIDDNRLKTDSEIIGEGLKFLQDISIALPLPRTISGHVKMQKNGELIGEGTDVVDMKVEVSGIANPSEDKREDESNLFAYTDASGYFRLVLPDKYNMQDTITLTVSRGANKQKFIKQASELLDNVYITKRTGDVEERKYARDLVAKFDQLDAINKEITKLEQQEDTLEMIQNGTEIHDAELKAKADAFVNSINWDKLKDDMAAKKAEREDLLVEIYGFDPVTNDLEKTLTNLLARTDLDTDAGNLVLNHNVFTGNFNDKPKVLPSVKLMGEGETAVKLPTDTAPSRVFNYNMIQRLVEPNVVPPAKSNSERETLDKPVDVGDFKKKIAENPADIPQMASLGIGYVLNMHQAWVPDGFALGTLLYSTILAPGEEQRLVVRESSQSYEVLDTAEGSEAVAEDYTTSQVDDTTATYNYAVNQLMTGESSSKFQVKSTSVGFSAGGGYMGCSLGLNVGHSKTSGSASSSARQSNSHDEASAAAQNFQHGIKTASERISQAKRISMRAATSNETDSVATRIIANHNHSHAMTIQYWEVVRRYKLETCIDSIDLILFVPFKPIQFLPLGESLFLEDIDIDKFDQARFKHRYDTVIRLYDTLLYRIPYKYRSGLNLVQKYASYPKWELEHRGDNIKATYYTLTLKGNFLEYDVVKATLCLANGKGSAAGQLVDNHSGAPTLTDIIDTYEARTKKEVEDAITNGRNTIGKTTMQFRFQLPTNADKQDISFIRLEYSCKPTHCKLYGEYEAWEDDKQKNLDYGYMNKYDPAWTTWEKAAVSNYRHKLYNLYEDHDYSKSDMEKIRHYAPGLPENYVVNEIDEGYTLTERMLRMLGGLTLDEFTVQENGESKEGATISSYAMQYNNVTIDISSHVPVMRYDELQKMEATLQHIATETMRYSQIIWSSLSDSERAMMLERYTVDMNFKNLFDNEVYDGLKEPINIPLLNCINVKKPLGYYGNCMLFPFTYPEKLAKKIGKTAAELQDALYRYHTSSFRVPSTIISLPTNGMIGEAVLGETNVSEEIDLTRFWNWKDSPIDSMEITDKYLNSTDYLSDKTTKDINALNLQGANATQAVTVPDLIAALVNKQTPTFDNITGLDQINSLLSSATSTNAAAQAKVVDNSNALATAALGYATEKLKVDKETNLENAKQTTMQQALAKGINPYQTTADKKTQTGDKQQDGGQQGGQHGGGQQGGGQQGGGQQGGGQNTDTSDFDDFFEDVSIDEFGMSGLSEAETNRFRCLMALASAGGDERYSCFKEYQRIQDKMKEMAGVEELEPFNRLNFMMYAGAMLYKYGLTQQEISDSSKFIVKKFGLKRNSE